MGIIDKIKGNPFEKLKKDELTAERIRLEREEKLKIAQVDKVAAQKKELFNKGFNASEAERRTMARQIQQLDQKMKLDNITLKRTSDQIRVIDNMIFIHENKQALEKEGLVWEPLAVCGRGVQAALSLSAGAGSWAWGFAAQAAYYDEVPPGCLSPAGGP